MGTLDSNGSDFPPGAHRYCVRTTVVGTPSGRVLDA